MAEWDILTKGIVKSFLSEIDVLKLISQGKIGTYAQARLSGQSPEQWRRIFEYPEFYVLGAYINPTYSSSSKIGEISGTLCVRKDVRNLIDVSKRVHESPDFSNVGFYLPVLGEEDFTANTRIFRLWDDFWTTGTVRPNPTTQGSSLTIYLFAINSSEKHQSHELHPSDFPVRDYQSDKLSFSLGPGEWGMSKLPIQLPLNFKLGLHVMSFRTSSGAEKLAKSALIGAATLGSFIYRPGHKGFSLSFEVRAGTVVPSLQHALYNQYSSGSLFCNYCGIRMGPGALYCPRCGSAIQSSQ